LEWLVLWEEKEVWVEASTESGEADHVGLRATGRSASSEGIPDITRGTRADRTVVPCLALSILSTRLITGRAAVVIIAGPVERALTVVDALASRAADERIPPPASRAGAHWPINPRPVKAWLAVGPRSAGVRGAQVFLLKPPATNEWVSGVATRTGADCLVIGSFTSCSLPTNIGIGLEAWVLTSQSDAGLVGSAVIVAGALGVTSGVSISQEIRWAGTLRSVVNRLTVGVFPAHSLPASSLTPVADPVALLGLAALIVRVALVSATLQRVPNVGVLAPTDWPVVRSHLTVSVGAARSTNLLSCESPTIAEWISGGSPRTPAYGHMVLYSAVGTLATRDGTRVDTLVVLARPLRSTVLVLVTFSLYTSRVRISLVARKTLTDRTTSNIFALCARAANPWLARVGTAARPAVGGAQVARSTSTHSSLSTSGAIGVRATSILEAGIETTRHVWVANVLRRALANCRSTIVLTDRPLSTGRALAGIEPTVCVRIADIICLAFANSRLSR